MGQRGSFKRSKIGPLTRHHPIRSSWRVRLMGSRKSLQGSSCCGTFCQQQLGAANTVYMQVLDPGSLDRLRAGESPIQVWREHRGLTIAALADRAGINESALEVLERTKEAFPAAVIYRIAEALEVDVDALLPLVKTKKDARPRLWRTIALAGFSKS